MFEEGRVRVEFSEIPNLNNTIITPRHQERFCPVPVENVNVAVVSVRNCYHVSFVCWSSVVPYSYTLICTARGKHVIFVRGPLNIFDTATVSTVSLLTNQPVRLTWCP